MTILTNDLSVINQRKPRYWFTEDAISTFSVQKQQAIRHVQGWLSGRYLVTTPEDISLYNQAIKDFKFRLTT